MPSPEDFQARIDAINKMASRLRPFPKPVRPVIVAFTPNGQNMGEHFRRFYEPAPRDYIGTIIDTRA